eukprot:gene11157-3215_t
MDKKENKYGNVNDGEKHNDYAENEHNNFRADANEAIQDISTKKNEQQGVIIIDDDDGSDSAEQDGESDGENECQLSRKKARLELDPAATEQSSTVIEETAAEKNRIRIVSWNINGLTDNPSLLLPRIRAMIDLVAKLNVDVVLLQEVTPDIFKQLSDDMNSRGYFSCDEPPNMPPPSHSIMEMLGLKMSDISSASLDTITPHYFTSMYVRKATIALLESNRDPFEDTVMMRDLASMDIRHSPTKQRIWIGNIHLESGQKASATRCSQLKASLKALDHHVIGLVAGDTNLRDSESNRVKKDFSKERIDESTAACIVDTWEALGSDSSTRYTWDMLVNDTLQMSGRTPRMRFDRCFSKNLSPVRFKLLGTERDPILGFISDHFGICVDFMLPNKKEKKK